MLKNISPLGQVFLFIFLVFICGMMGSSILGLALMPTVSEDMLINLDMSDARIILVLNLFSQVFSFLVAFLVYLRITGERFSDLIQIQKIQLKPLLITLTLLVICFVAFPIFELLNEPLRQILPNDVLAQEIRINEQNEALFFQSDPIQFAFSLVVVALLPAIFEELVFRGFLIKKMMQSGMSDYGAVLMSAVIFSITHFQPMKFLAMFTLGAIFGFLYIKYRNIKYSMILHFLFNGTQIAMAFLAGSGLPYIDI